MQQTPRKPHRPHALITAFVLLIPIAAGAAICGLTITGTQIIAGWIVQ